MSQQLKYKDILSSQLPEDLYKGDNIESRALGRSLDRVQRDIDILELEVNPLTAKLKGLEDWEEFFKLPSNANDDLNTRRAKVVSELIQFVGDENVIRKDEMESIVSLYADGCEIVEHFAEYIFDVIITLEDLNILKISDVVSVIEQIKPSFTKYKFILKRDYVVKIESFLKAGNSLLPLCNTIEAGEWPYQQNTGKLECSRMINKIHKSIGIVHYNEAATIKVSEKLYEEYEFAKMTGFEFKLISRHGASLKELEYKKVNEVFTGKHPYAKNEIKQSDSQITNVEKSTSNTSTYELCGEVFAGGDNNDG